MRSFLIMIDLKCFGFFDTLYLTNMVILFSRTAFMLSSQKIMVKAQNSI